MARRCEMRCKLHHHVRVCNEGQTNVRMEGQRRGGGGV